MALHHHLLRAGRRVGATLGHRLLTRGVDIERASARVDAERQAPEHQWAIHKGADTDDRTLNEWALPVVAGGVVEHYARRAALRSLLTGLPGGFAALPLTLLDSGGNLTARAELALALHLLVDEDFAGRPDWRQRVTDLAYALEQTETRSGEPSTNAPSANEPPLQADLAQASQVALGALRVLMAERGPRLLGRRLGRRLIPLAGGVVSAAVTYRWMRAEGRRIFDAVHQESMRP